MDPAAEAPTPETPHPESVIAGFDITLEDHHRAHIDLLVDEYQSGIIAHLDQEYARTTTKADKLADRIASFGGSWRFILIFSGLLTAWILWNTAPAMKALQFDPAPFILLNLCLSFVAAFQAPIIMMSQNRQAAKDRSDARLDYEVNVRAELQITALHEKLDLARDREWMHMARVLEDHQALLARIEQRLEAFAAGDAPRE